MSESANGEERDLYVAPDLDEAQSEQAESSDEERLAARGVSDELLARRREALQRVCQFGDPVLRAAARSIDEWDDDLAQQADRMIALMHDALGIGLAAPQMGSSRRLLVYQVGTARPMALANPVIEWSSDESDSAEEGCLSLRNVEVDVERPVFVRVKAQDVSGEPFTIEASGLEARVIQHEMDHLDGVLIIDRASKDQRKAALKALRDAEAGSGYAA